MVICVLREPYFHGHSFFDDESLVSDTRILCKVVLRKKVKYHSHTSLIISFIKIKAH